MNKSFKGYKSIIFSFVLILSLFDRYAAFAHSPHDEIYTLDISPTYAQDKTLFAVVRNNLLKSQDGGSSWKRIVRGLDNQFADFSSLVFSQESNSLFLSSNGTGIYKSQDNGSSWFKVNNRLDNLNIGLLSISTNQVVFAAGASKGLYKTINGGKDWVQVINSSSPITAIAASDNEYKLIGDAQGILDLSTDGGNVWRQRFQFLNSGAISAIAISPNFSVDQTFFVGTAKGGIFKTVNSGTSFLAVNNGVLDKNIKSLVLSPNYRTDATIFASTWHQAVFRSINGGDTWQKNSQGITTDPQADEFKVPQFRDLSISQTFAGDKTIFLAGFDGLFKSTDGGLVWKQMDTLPRSLILGLALSPSYRDDHTVAVTTYIGGFYKTINKGITWTAINKGLQSTRIGDLVFSPNYRLDNTIFSYTSNFILKSTDRGNNWRKISCGGSALPKLSPTRIAISPSFTSDGTIYFGTRNGKILRSKDSGEHCSAIFSAPDYIKSLVISPNFPSEKTLYAAAGQGVYKTLDGGNTWQAVSNGLTNSSIELAISPNHLAISPNHQVDKTVFVGTTGGVFKTTNGGQNWVKLAGSTYGKNGFIETIAISPNYQNDHTVIIHVKGKGLFKTINGGETFVQVANNLITNNQPLASMYKFPSTGVPIQFSPSYSVDKTIYGTSAEELFQSTDGGNTWRIITIPMR